MRLAVLSLPKLGSRAARRRAVFEPDWAPRELNQKADDLTSEVFTAFSDEHRVHVSVDSLPWLVFPKLVHQARKFYADILAEHTAAALQAGPSSETLRRAGPKRPGLKETDPW